MFRKISMVLMATMILVFGGQSKADVSADMQVLQLATHVQAMASGLGWKVGDRAEYSIKAMGGFINGKMVTFVREETATEFWLQQDADLGFAGKQKIEILFNKANGQILKVLVNGKEEQLPKNNSEIVEMTEDHVTVPAGTFACIHAKIKDKDNGQIQEAWINPKEIPISGLLKSIGQTQMGEVSNELTSFKFAN